MSLRHSALLACVLLAGCGQADSQAEAEHPAGSRFFSKAESRAVGVAKASLEQKRGKRVDARYKVTEIPEGYSVHVSYVVGYDHGRPIFVAGAHCIVLVSKAWTFMRILPGA